MDEVGSDLWRSPCSQQGQLKHLSISKQPVAVFDHPHSK